MTLRDAVEEVEKATIIRTLKAVNGNKLQAAKLLEISRTSLYEKVEKYHIGDLF